MNDEDLKKMKDQLEDHKLRLDHIQYVLNQQPKRVNDQVNKVIQQNIEECISRVWVKIEKQRLKVIKGEMKKYIKNEIEPIRIQTNDSLLYVLTISNRTMGLFALAGELLAKNKLVVWDEWLDIVNKVNSKQDKMFKESNYDKAFEQHKLMWNTK